MGSINILLILGLELSEMPIALIKVNVSKSADKKIEKNEEIIENLPVDTNYWNTAASVLFERMLAAGLLKSEL
jgi:hypothetical protein